jgi:hypothetical protein
MSNIVVDLFQEETRQVVETTTEHVSVQGDLESGNTVRDVFET